jgi:hypothetical protein
MIEYINGIKVPSYISHKVVQALPIKEVISTGADMGGDVVFADFQRYGTLHCEAKMFSRYVPQPGDYLVFYEDGYKSFSPKKAFEDGYTIKGE